MATIQKWTVAVGDHLGAPVSNAVISVVEHESLLAEPYPYDGLSAAFDETSPGHYEAEADSLGLASGRWALVVLAEKKSPVVQPFAIKGRSGRFRASAQSRDMAATVSLAEEHLQVADDETLRTVFRVSLYPATEYVFLVGADPHGTNLLNFAKGRMEALHRLERLTLPTGEPNLGAVFTVMSCPHRNTSRFVKARSGWLELGELGELKAGTGNRYSEAFRHVTARDGSTSTNLSITDFYGYLSDIGTLRPHTVAEASIFSHAFVNGPILWDTDEEIAFENAPERNPKDMDGRAKDFNGTNFPAWSGMTDAFAPGATYRLWGCFADRSRIARMQTAMGRDVVSDDQPFEYRSSLKGRWKLSAATTPKETRADLINTLTNPNERYLVAAAARLPIPVFGAPPGVSASFFGTRDGAANIMVCDTFEYASTYDFLQKHVPQLGLHIESDPKRYDRKQQVWDDLESHEQGYIDYQKARTLAPPPLVRFNPALYFCIYDERKNETLLSFDPAGVTRTFKRPNEHAVTREPFSAGGETGFRYVLVRRSERRALFVTETARVFRLEPNGKGDPVVLGAEIR